MAWWGGLCSPGFKVRQEDFGWPMGKGLETGGPGKAGVCVVGLNMEGSLRVPLRPLGTVLDLMNLRRRLRSPFAPRSHAPRPMVLITRLYPDQARRGAPCT